MKNSGKKEKRRSTEGVTCMDEYVLGSDEFAAVFLRIAVFHVKCGRRQVSGISCLISEYLQYSSKWRLSDWRGNLVSQLEMLDAYYKDKANSESDEESDDKDVTEAYREQELSESEKMAEEIEDAINKYGISDEVDVSFNAEYVLLNMNGALLFDSGKAEVKSEAYPLIDKLGKVIQKYDKNIIEVEGHTDNVPQVSSDYADNNVLSMFRALNVADYLRETTTIDPRYLKSSGRGEYRPIADNSTPEGRALNRRVEIKIYNSYNSEID